LNNYTWASILPYLVGYKEERKTKKKNGGRSTNKTAGTAQRVSEFHGKNRNRMHFTPDFIQLQWKIAA